MKIAFIHNNFIPCGVYTFFRRALEKTEHEVQHFWLKDAKTIPHEFDLYFRVDEGDYATPDIPAHLKPSIYYAVDTHLPRSRKAMEAFLPNYDSIFCAQNLIVDTWKKKFKNVYWIPFGYDPEVHRMVPNSAEPKYDLAFVGSLGGQDRKYILQEMRERYPNSFIGTYPFLSISEIYNQAKIGLNYSIYHDINMRMFEVLASGRMLLTNRINDPMMESLFKSGEEIVIYENLDDLCKKADYFLSHSEERERISKQGHEMILQGHSYLDRVQSMLDLAQKVI